MIRKKQKVGWYGTMMKWALVLVATGLGIILILAIVGKIDKRVYPPGKTHSGSRR